MAPKQFRSAEESAEKAKQARGLCRYQYLRARAALLDCLSSPTSAPVPPEDLPVFVCIDVEAWEFDASRITEVGLSVFSVSWLEDRSSGHRAVNWRNKIHSYHYRTDSNPRHVNRKHVKGCPDAFNFGSSSAATKSQTTSLLKKFFMSQQQRVILVGHNVSSDILMLSKANIIDLNLFVVDVFDTSDIFRYLKRDPLQPSLQKLLEVYEIEATNLHNGGNDARYTLEVFLAMMVHETAHFKTKEQWADAIEIAVRKAKEAAERNVRRAMADWDE